MKTDRIYKFQIRQDLIDEDLKVPIIWIEPVFSCGKLLTNSRKETRMITAESGSFKEDYPDHGSHFLEHTPTLEVKESFPEEMDEIITTEGHNTIISVTDPEHGWVDRKALAYSIDFQCYDESDPRIKDDTIEIFIPHGAWLAPQKVVTEEGSVWIWKLVGWKDEVYCDSKGHQENIEGEIRINLQANTAENLIEEIQEENHA